MPKPRCNNPACGAWADEDAARFCGRCGAALPRRITPTLPPRPTVPTPLRPGPVALRDIAWRHGAGIRAAPVFEVCTLAPRVARAPVEAAPRARATPLEFSSVALVVALVMALVAMIGSEAPQHTARRVAPAAAPATLSWSAGR